MKKKQLLILTLTSLVMVSCCYSIFVKYPGIQIVNDSDLELYMFDCAVALEGKDNSYITPHWTVPPHKTVIGRYSMYYSKVEDLLDDDGTLRITFINKADVDKYSWEQVVEQKIFLYEYIITEENLADYLIDERTLSFSYPPTHIVGRERYQVDYDGNKVGNNRPDVQWNADGVHHN